MLKSVKAIFSHVPDTISPQFLSWRKGKVSDGERVPDPLPLSPSPLEFVTDFSKRVAGRLQVTSDGFKPYIGAMEECFGADVDFAQLIKIYGKPDNAGPDWYGPPKVIETVPTPVSGKPDFAHICTSHVERANLSVRMHLRRFTRLVNAFSKKLHDLKAAVALYVTWYNLCRVHMTLRVTPAMEAGLTNHIWDLRELFSA